MPNRRAILKMLVSIAIWPLGCIRKNEDNAETQQEIKDNEPSSPPETESAEPTVSQEPEHEKPTDAQKGVEKRYGNTEEKVRKIIVDHLCVDASEVKYNALFIDDLGADSLDTVELVMAFEEEFNIEIPDEDAMKMNTVGDAIRYLDKKTNGSIK